MILMPDAMPVKSSAQIYTMAGASWVNHGAGYAYDKAPIALKPSGTILYAHFAEKRQLAYILQHALSSPDGYSSAAPASSGPSSESMGKGLFVSQDGTVIVVLREQYWEKFVTPTPWDFTAASLAGSGGNLPNMDGALATPSSLVTVNRDNSMVTFHRNDLASDFDFTSLSAHSVSTPVPLDINPTSVAVSPDMSRVWVVANNNFMYEFSVTVPGDFSNVTYGGVSIPFSNTNAPIYLRTSDMKIFYLDGATLYGLPLTPE